MVTAFAPYKRVELAVEAFARLNWPLKIVGAGQDEKRLRHLSAGTVELVGWKSDAEIADLYARCRAFIFPGEEDFGITPLEAQAAGRPVIALGRGGAVETVVAHRGFHPVGEEGAKPTGVLFPRQDVSGLVEALEFFTAHESEFDDPAPMVENASRFSLERFTENIRALLAQEGVLS
jgi:glycosyltransferase involved in cell wall biosynthesis